MSFFDPKKIVFICNSLSVKAGVESRTLEQMLYFRSKGCQVELCILREEGPIADMYRSHGIKVHFIQVYKQQMITCNPLKLIKLSFFLLSNRFGTIICVQHPSHYFGRLACFPLLGRKNIIMERTAIENRPKLKFLLDYLLSFLTHKMVCIGRQIKTTFLKKTNINPDKLIVIENGIKLPEAPNPMIEKKKKFGNNLVFGSVGMLIPSKRINILIQSFAQVLKKFPNSFLIIVGDGPEKENLKKLSRSLRIEKQIFFTGQQFKLHDFYPLFDIFVFPTISEGFGTVLYEAMAYKLPTISTNIKPMNDYVTNGHTALLFEADNLDSLTNKMIELSESERLRKEIGFNGYQFVRHSFDYSQQLEKIYKLIFKN